MRSMEALRAQNTRQTFSVKPRIVGCRFLAIWAGALKSGHRLGQFSMHLRARRHETPIRRLAYILGYIGSRAAIT